MQSSRTDRRFRRLILGGLAPVAIFLIACLGTAAAGPSSNSGKPQAEGAATVEAKAVTDPALGKVLVDSHGMTLYVFHGDNPMLYQFHQDPAPSCFEFCEEFWPPLLTTGAPKGTGGVDGELLGTVRRPDGTTQVTYDGHPLYTCSEDTESAEVNGEGIEMFDDTWYAIGPAGDDA